MPDALGIIYLTDLVQIRMYSKGQRCWTWFYWLDIENRTFDA
jgi:hypothetical protein